MWALLARPNGALAALPAVSAAVGAAPAMLLLLLAQKRCANRLSTAAVFAAAAAAAAAADSPYAGAISCTMNNTISTSRPTNSTPAKGAAVRMQLLQHHDITT